ncbi:hypothetical protein DY000_02038547 [Brassica cretica]|uniref:AT-hook motif nuclear-localized protein n=1 Tax=Brassica cretica TaxID=69181 RepID=A0ABQ7BJJ8_BRACR|nr:hypothetical protein DY000_02038547 [Brassica cretica]
MGKRKGPKKASPPKIPLGAHVSGSFATGAPPTSGSPNDSKISKEQNDHLSNVTKIHQWLYDPKEDASLLITASASTLQDPISEPTFGSGKQNTVDTMNSAKVIQVTNPGKSQTCDEKEGGELSPENPKCVSESEAAIPKTGDVAAPVANITAGKGDESHENPSSDKPDM